MSIECVVILCGGMGARWAEKSSIPKQLVEINGEPILVRTVRQLRSRGIKNIIILTSDPRLKLEGCLNYLPKKHRWITETLLNSLHLWQKKTLVLCGDVYFSDYAVDKLVNWIGTSYYGVNRGCDGIDIPEGALPHKFFGMQADLNNESLCLALQQATNNAIRLDSTESSGRHGSFWKLYTFWYSLQENPSNVFFEIIDTTNDFDSWEELKTWTSENRLSFQV